MAVGASLARLGASLIALLHTRAALASVEVEEEALRYFTYLLQTLTAMFLLALASMLAVLLLVVLFWEAHRITTLVLLIFLLASAGIGLGMRVRSRYRHKPQLLGATLNELARDVATLGANS